MDGSYFQGLWAESVAFSGIGNRVRWWRPAGPPNGLPGHYARASCTFSHRRLRRTFTHLACGAMGAQQPGEHRSSTHLNEQLHALGHQFLHAVDPATGFGTCS